MKLLAYDGPLATAIHTVFEMVVLNFCFCICCVPLVTAGTAITALYAVYLNKDDERAAVTRFFSAFKSNFSQATRIWLILLAVGAVILADLYIVAAADFPGRLAVLIALVVLGVVYLSVGAFAFALQAHYNNTLKRTLQNALLLGTVGIVTGVLVVAVSFFPVIVFWVAIDFLAVVLSVWIPVGASLAARINSWMLRMFFEQFQTPPETIKNSISESESIIL